MTTLLVRTDRATLHDTRYNPRWELQPCKWECIRVKARRWWPHLFLWHMFPHISPMLPRVSDTRCTGRGNTGIHWPNLWPNLYSWMKYIWLHMPCLCHDTLARILLDLLASIIAKFQCGPDYLRKACCSFHRNSITMYEVYISVRLLFKYIPINVIKDGTEIPTM